MINADVILLRSAAPEDVAGNYASAAILVKATFMLPATLSLYLLPRFVRNRGNRSLVRVGERLTIGITLVSGIALALVFWLAADFVTRLVYGASFGEGSEFLVPLALVYLPWITAQAVLIKLTADASRVAALVAVGAVACQVVGFAIVIPDVNALMWVQGILGTVVVVAFTVLAMKPARSVPARLEIRT
jgi:O-antigen/teichoic acid export membrane protein